MTVKDPSAAGASDIAIVGMACRLPGSRNIDEYWANLTGGVESIRQLSDKDLDAAGVSRRDREDPNYVKACPVLDDIDKFDAAFFGISPRDASVMDPAHRFFLEVAWQALEDAGNTGLADEAVVGVYAASGAPLYWMNNVASHRDLVESMGEFLVRHTGNDMNFLATRASYDLDLRGPSLNVQTACSSALVAVHLARQSLLAGECSMALVGGSTILVPMGQGYHFKEGEILSPDGHCRPFDHRSAGTVFGSGTACLVLKRLGDALDNGDNIYAVVKGSAVNNDGSMKVGFLAPGVDGQVEVIKSALACAGVNARSIGYVEAHGTGTSVGDPIELTALEQAFAEQTNDKQFCGIGSVKSNIGHLGEAAAAASLIKVALALKHRTLPPSLGFEKPNPRFAMNESPFYVNAHLKAWEGTSPLRAGITALGAGGTNCHLVLEEAPAFLPGEGGRSQHLLQLSAKSKGALDRMSANLAAHLSGNPTLDLADVAYTLAMGRRQLSHRRVVVARDHADAVALLTGQEPTRVGTIAADSSDPTVVYMFPGGGSQYARMCLDLYEGEIAFRSALDECFEIIDRELDRNIRALLFAAPSEAEVATKSLQRPSMSLPTLFAVEYALAKLFDSYGLKPAAYIGHSMGEYVAACLAGVFSLRDGLRLVHLRGRLFESTQTGKMVGVSLSEDATRALMPKGLSIAAVNAPSLCVASGPVALVDQFSKTLTEQEVDWTPIHIDVAAHSSLLEPILEEFRQFCRTIDFRAPKTPIASNLTGRWLSAAEATDPEYWVKHLRNTVRFADCVETVLAAGSRVFLEIGPGRTLATLVGAQATQNRNSFNSVRHPKEAANDVQYALLALGKVWAAGAKVDWTALYDEQIRNRVPLPGYPFEGQSYWVKPQALQFQESAELVKRENLDEWFYTVGWESTPLVASKPAAVRHWLLFGSDLFLSGVMIEAIKAQTAGPCEVVLVTPGADLSQLERDRFECYPGDAGQYQQVFEQLKSEGRIPQHVVMLVEQGPSGVDEKLLHHFFAPVHLAQAMSAVLDQGSFTIVTQDAFSVGTESVNPWARLAVGPAQVIPRELPDLLTRHIDLRGEKLRGESMQATVQQLVRELTSADTVSPVALRAPQRFSQHLRSTAMPSLGSVDEWLSDGDVVLITGGLGGIGLAIAEHLATKKKIKLALLSREGLPGQPTWNALLNSENTKPYLKLRLKGVQSLLALGAQVFAVQGDVTDKSSLAVALAELRSRFGPVSVVIHAAGTMDDEPFSTKSDEKMHKVLRAKVQGTINLDSLIFDELKAFVLMSSVASFLGLPGQIDYTAANAFLDAFACDRQSRKPGHSLAINWNAWRDVGMVVQAEDRAAHDPLPSGSTSHLCLQASEETPQGRRYFSDFSVGSSWLLGEHKVVGADALIPGTGFVELARAAFVDASSYRAAQAGNGQCVELSNVTFLSPFQVAATQIRRLQIDVQWLQGVANVQMRTAGSHEAHMTADLKFVSAAVATIDLVGLQSRCTGTENIPDGFLDQDFVEFGPRWKNLNEIHVGQGEALISLTLDSRFTEDLETFAYHPALLDMATGAAQMLIPGFRKGQDFFVPFGYDRIVIFAPVGQRIFSHVRLRTETSKEVATFDVKVTDELGTELIGIEGFTMRRVDPQSAIAQHSAKPNAAMLALLAEAMTKTEGLIGFDRAMSQAELSQIVVSSVDVNTWLKKLATDSKRLGGESNTNSAPTFSRPELASDYIVPESPLEVALAAMWSKLLGVKDVGVLDDFFELGGNSLVAVRFFARVKKDLGLSLPLSTLFTAPSIRPLSAVMRAHGYIERLDETPTQAVVEVVTVPVAAAAVHAQDEAPSVMPPILIRPGSGRTALFFVHDGLGEVLLYRTLALRLAPGHAVYGLQPESSRGQFIHTSIAEMARAKVERIRSVQPKGPYALAGLCAGGVIAFEIARQLQDIGENTLFVCIIDAADVEAQERRLRSARDRLTRVIGSVRRPGDENIASYLGGAAATVARKAMNLVTYEVSTRLEQEKNKQRVATMRSGVGGLDSELPVIEFLRLYELAHQRHKPTGVLRGSDVVLFRATAGTGDVADVPFREVYVDPFMGWKKRVDGPVTAIDIPGGHSSALQDPHVRQLAKELQAQLDRVEERNL